MRAWYYAERLKAIHINATYTESKGWHLDVLVHRNGEHWNDAYRATYRHLSFEELQDVIDAEIDTQL